MFTTVKTSCSVRTSWICYMQLQHDNCKRQLQSNYCKTTIAKQELQNDYCKTTIATRQLQNTNCKTIIAKRQSQHDNCKPTIAKHQLQKIIVKQQMQNTSANNNWKTTIEKQQLLKQNVKTTENAKAEKNQGVPAEPPPGQRKKMSILRWGKIRGPPPRARNRFSSKAIKNPYRLRLPLGKKTESMLATI